MASVAIRTSAIWQKIEPRRLHHYVALHLRLVFFNSQLYSKVLCISFTYTNKEINDGLFWELDNWAMNCEFFCNEFRREFIPSEECHKLCENISDCSHYSWNNGVCYIKSGQVSKDKAVPKLGFSCGIKAPIIPRILFDICNINFYIQVIYFIPY